MPHCTLTQAQVYDMLAHVREDGTCAVTLCRECRGLGAPCTSMLDFGPEYRRRKIAYLQGLLDPDYVARKRAEEDARYEKEPL